MLRTNLARCETKSVRLKLDDSNTIFERSKHLFMSSISIVIADRFYSKDPQSSELGKKIVNEGLRLIDELGFEQFTFKKLAERIGSTEASIYRYFENKQKLLIYLTTWYWSWIDYKIDYETHHIKKTWKKLERIWEVICQIDIDSNEEVAMDISALRRIAVSESDKTYLTKHVDEINKEGLFRDFKSLCGKISSTISEINPEYKYPNALVSTLMEASHQQFFFSTHLPSLTEVEKGDSHEMNQSINRFINEILCKVLK